MAFRGKMVVLLVFVFFVSSWALENYALAEEKKGEWIDSNFNFHQLKMVLVQYSIDDGINLDEGGKQKLKNKLNEIFFKEKDRQNVKLVSIDQVEKTVGKAIGIDIAVLKETDPGQYNEIMAKNLPKNIDAVLKLKIVAQGYTTKHIEASTQYITQHNYIYITTISGYINGSPVFSTQRYDNPITLPVIIPEHDVQVGHAGIEFELQSSKGLEPIWHLTDLREAESKEPIDMTARICNRTLEKLANLIQGKKYKPDPPLQ